jgi:hypothetical protein
MLELAGGGEHTGRTAAPGGGEHAGRTTAPGGEAETRAAVAAGLLVLEELPAKVRAAYGKAATAALLDPLALRARGTSDVLSAATAAVLSDAVDVLRTRYAHLSGEYQRLAGRHLDPLPDDSAVVGVAGAATAAVAAVLRGAWPWVVRAVRALAAWAGKNPLKAAGAGLALSAAPDAVRAVRALSRAARTAAGGIERASGFAGGLGGIGLIILAWVLLSKRRRD